MAKIVQNQCWQCNQPPRQLDRLAAEVSEVCIKCLGARHGKEHEAENDQAEQTMTNEKRDSIERVECKENPGIVDDMDDATARKHQEP